MPNADVIVAVSTPPGESALGVVRLSGSGCLGAASRFIRFKREPAPRSAEFCEILSRGETLDRALVTFFPGPNSYTGEDMLEVSAHGSPFILSEIMREAAAAGARPAEPGEFTERAFLNGRIDLAQAEAVCALIRSRTRAAHRVAMAQLDGKLSERIRALRDAVLGLLAALEAQLDHPDEEIPVLSREDMGGRLASLRADIDALLSTYPAGRVALEGARVAILGRPNVGKSSLLNALLGRDRAIVAETPGTTRDTLEEQADLAGLKAVLIDTAGLREDSGDSIERAGMERSRAALKACDVALVVLDRSRALGPDDARLLEEVAAAGALEGRPILCALNKSDLPAAAAPDALGRPWPAVEVSATRGDGLDALARAVAEAAGGAATEEGAVIATARHARALESARAALAEAAGVAEPELAAVHLREALLAVGSIAGEAASDDVLRSIFSKFCIGK
ncbi:MAG: tRNA uridine-5-carboxymethylaminomethyl(34) synthesis GTPase MnmE [Elusimicrobia bacterium]|nr:tRNA uridine-5-carboxymethylaminomethyl(34) synthesis GTPase MnmE [Elusimicrobiota bacterium]